MTKPTSLPRCLFWLGCSLAVGLLLLVVAAPLLARSAPQPRWLTLFAEDPTLRKTSIFSAMGLFVTAWVFFKK